MPVSFAGIISMVIALGAIISSRHMSWLHCIWGFGAAIGPYVMGVALSGGTGWNRGYRYISLAQMFLAAILAVSLPLLRTRKEEENGREKPPILGMRKILAIPGAKAMVATSFCYCSLGQTAIIWASSYLVMQKASQRKLLWPFLAYSALEIPREGH